MRSAIAMGLMFALAVGSAWAGVLYGIRDSDNALIAIDTDSLAVTLIGSTTVSSGDFGDLAYDHSTNTMYWIAGRGNNNLYTIDLNTGKATLVGSHGIGDLFTLGWDSSSDRLFAQSTNQNVYVLDKNTAVPTLIGSNSVYPGGYDYNWDIDKLILLEAGGGRVYEINRTNGAATLIADPGAWINDNDIAWDFDKNVWWALDYSGFLYKYDANWQRTTVLSNLGPFAAAEYIPEPGSLSLLALVGLIGIRRR